jgi:two-component system, NtrC family, sensor kinase
MDNRSWIKRPLTAMWVRLRRGAMRRSRRDLGAAEARHRQSLFLSLAVLLLTLVPVEAYIFDGIDPWLVLNHLVLSAAFVVASILTRRLGSAVVDPVDLTLSASSSIFLVLAVVRTGGSHSPFLPWCLVMPVAVTMFARRQIRDSVLSSLICCLSTMVLLWVGHADRRTLVAWGFLVFATAFVAVSSSLLQVRVLNTLDSLGHSRRRLDQRRAQSKHERMEARRLALVGQLAAGVAHQVNNPLAVVKANLGFARNELLQRMPEPWCATVLESLGEAAGGVERIRLLVRDLADLAPPSGSSSASEECEPGELVADAVDMVRAGTSVEIVTKIEPELHPIRIVRPHIVQVLTSLLHNAVDAVEGLPVGRPRRVLIRASDNSFGIQFDVEDTGAGFSAPVLARLFEPFFSTKPIGSGRGLNLAKSREHVIRSGGSIRAENLPDGGARFSVTLPPGGDGPGVASPVKPKEVPLGLTQSPATDVARRQNDTTAPALGKPAA